MNEDAWKRCAWGVPGTSLGGVRAEAQGPRGSLRAEPKATQEGTLGRTAHRVRSRFRKEREMCAWLEGRGSEKVEDRSGKIPGEGNDGCGQESDRGLTLLPTLC